MPVSRPLSTVLFLTVAEFDVELFTHAFGETVRNTPMDATYCQEPALVAKRMGW